MSINVVCPGCHTRFKVSDRFAGRSGVCPKCKTAIQVPSAEEQVKVHTPEQFDRGGRGVTGKLILKPIAREQTKLSLVLAVGVLGATVVVFLAAWLAGSILQQHGIVRALALLLISLPLAWAGYLFLRDDENLETYSGKPLVVRTAICAAAYAALWGIFTHVAAPAITGDVWSWLLVAPPFVITGALVALACYDLDFVSGCLHYAFYLLVTVLLGGCAGLGWIWQIGQMI